MDSLHRLSHSPMDFFHGLFLIFPIFLSFSPFFPFLIFCDFQDVFYTPFSRYKEFVPIIQPFTNTLTQPYSLSTLFFAGVATPH